MFNKKYRLSYLLLFYEDLDEKVTYIAEKLKNSKAAKGILLPSSHQHHLLPCLISLYYMHCSD